MTQKAKEGKEPVKVTEHHSIPGAFDISYTYSVGALGSRFFTELRDNQKIMGMRCPQCNQVYVPPRLTCFRCFSKLDEWVEVSNKGTVDSFTVVNYSEAIHPMSAPFAYAIIKLDGADTGMNHLLGEVDLDKITVGMRVEPVFAEERTGSILDIKYFKPL